MLAQARDVVGVLVGVVDAVVRLRQALLAVEHQRGTVLVQLAAENANRVGQLGLRERLEAVGRRVPDVACASSMRA